MPDLEHINIPDLVVTAGTYQHAVRQLVSTLDSRGIDFESNVFHVTRFPEVIEAAKTDDIPHDPIVRGTLESPYAFSAVGIKSLAHIDDVSKTATDNPLRVFRDPEEHAGLVIFDGKKIERTRISEDYWVVIRGMGNSCIDAMIGVVTLGTKDS